MCCVDALVWFVLAFQLLSLVGLGSTIELANTRFDYLPRDCGRRLLTAGDTTKPFIVGPGNTTAYHGQYPWQARLEVYNTSLAGYAHKCGGVIIAPRYILTAAHCVESVAINLIQVRVGDLTLGPRETGEKEYGVEDIRIHQAFRQGIGRPNDIALLLLRTDGIEFGAEVQPACLPAPHVPYETNLECEVSGWGKTSTHGPLSPVLRGVTVYLVSDDYCGSAEVYGRTSFLAGKMTCAGLVRGGVDACEGDSGGPLVCRDRSTGRFVNYGIVSAGDPLGCGKRPGIYTKVTSYVPWVLSWIQVDVIRPDLRVSLNTTESTTTAARPTGDATPPEVASVDGSGKLRKLTASLKRGVGGRGCFGGTLHVDGRRLSSTYKICPV